MLEIWLSNEILLSNSTPRFLTDEKDRQSSCQVLDRILGYYMWGF